MDWIHNLVYYNQNNKIIVFNLTNPGYGFLVTNEKENIIIDLSVNPLDSFISGRSISFRPSLNWADNNGSEKAILLVHI